MRKKSWLIALAWLIQSAVSAQPVANFSANPTSGCAPLVVSFSDLSSGNPTQWTWDLGNGTTSYLRNPSVSYLNPGTYTITLTVSNANGSNSITRQQYITVYSQPSVNFGASVRSGCFPLQIRFTDSTVITGGNITNWLWDFGDGNFSSQQNPSHTYQSAGVFNVSLRVRTGAGCTKTVTKPYFIRVFDGVTADFSTSAINTCQAPALISFNNLSSGNGSLQFQWNFGDGNSSTDVNPTNSYNSNGNYTVRLIVRNSNGCSDTLTRANVVSIGAMQTNFSTTGPNCINSTIRFTNNSSPAPSSSTWQFGDGNRSDSIHPEHRYAAPGNYLVKLVNDYGGCKDSVIRSITVEPKPTAAFNTTDTLSCLFPYTVNFTNQSTNGNSYRWDFGDGNTSTQANPVHTYRGAGSFTVRLITTGSSGCNDTITKNNIIRIQLPEAGIDSLPQEGCAPFTWTFRSRLNSLEPAVSYHWDFGDGNTSNLPTPTHTFDSGIYTIKLIIITASGCTDTVIANNAIRVGVKPVSNFSANPLSACANTRIDFTDLSQGDITRWLWFFGDGGTSTVQNPSHVYADTGFFTVTLIVFNLGCPDTLILEDYIYIKPPIAKLNYVIDCSQKYTRAFTGSRSIGADTYEWNFGDGTTSTQADPVHTYSTAGTYSVTLRVTNTESGCQSERTRVIEIVDEQADFSSSDTASCKNNPVSFSAINSNPSRIRSYQWFFGDGGTASGRNATYAYPNQGTYSVTLIITDINGCKDTMSKAQYIRIDGPTADFNAANTNLCINNTVVFNNLSVSDGRNPIVSLTWDFGDGNSRIINNAPFSHTYSTPGIFTVSLLATDSKGCTSMKSVRSLIRVSRPIASFVSPDTLTCPGRTVRFTNRSSGTGLRYRWDFGDGFTDSIANPTHIFSSDGYYSIRLVVTDRYGCTDSLIRNQYIKVITGEARFTASDTISNCPPLIVSFTNTSLNAVSYSWDFGDGTSSTLRDPAHFFSEAGVYVVRLTAKGVGGCFTHYSKTITVKGPSGNFSYNPLSGCRPLQVSFMAHTRNCDTILWDFADGYTLLTTDTTVTHVYTIPGNYVPRMILINDDGCRVPVQGPDTIRVYGVDASFDFTAPVFCGRGTVQFRNTSTSNENVAHYRWEFGDGNTSSLQNPLHTYDSTGSFLPVLIATTVNGCRDTFRSVTPVRISGFPEVNISRGANGCAPVTVDFSASNSNQDTTVTSWNWNFGNGQSSVQQNPGNIIFSNAGDYRVTLTGTNGHGCADTATTVVTAYAIPVVSAGPDAISCHERGITLRATGAATYQWTPSTGLSCTNCAEPVANPDSAITYRVTGTSAQGCINSDSIHITVYYPFQMRVSRGDSICRGESIFIYANGAYSYTWTPAVNSLNTNRSIVSVSPSNSTVYRVTGTDDANCFTQTMEVPITVFPIPTVEAGENKTIPVGNTVDLVPRISSDVTEVNWSPTGSVFRSTYPAISVKPRETTEYTVEVANAGGCTAKDNVTVYVTCDGANVFIPNTFTPNNDGMNDVFYPRGHGLFRIKSMKIFNRWGEQLFLRNDFQPNNNGGGWDGTYKGKPLNPDVYIYVIEILCDNNSTLLYKGNIALLK